jgi:hypothetical protein
MCKFVERFGRSSVGFGGVDPRVLYIPSCPGYIGLTGALDQSEWCESLVGFALGELFDSCVFGSWCCWSVLGLFGVANTVAAIKGKYARSVHNLLAYALKEERKIKELQQDNISKCINLYKDIATRLHAELKPKVPFVVGSK